MKVLHINHSVRGGAAVASLLLHGELLKRGVHSRYLVLDSPTEVLNEVYSHRQTYKSAFRKAYYLYLKAYFVNKRNEAAVRNLPSPPELFSLPYTPFDITLDEQYEWADIIHLHWINRFVDYRMFFTKNRKPIVWTIHDKEPFSGGLHCTTQFPFDAYSHLLHEIEAFKVEQVKDQQITVVAPSSEYMALSAKSAILGKFPHRLIHHGIDHETYYPHRKSECRLKHGLPLDKKILLTVAADLNRVLKGFSFIRDLSNEVADDNLMFCTIGSKLPEMQGKHNVINLGEVVSHQTLAEIYSAADGYISASLEESFGLTVVEALSCGVPVIAFAAGGVNDTVVHNQNGLLVPVGDYEALKQTVEQFVVGNVHFDSQKIADDAKLRFDICTQTSQYINLYNSILL